MSSQTIINISVVCVDDDDRDVVVVVAEFSVIQFIMMLSRVSFSNNTISCYDKAPLINTTMDITQQTHTIHESLSMETHANSNTYRSRYHMYHCLVTSFLNIPPPKTSLINHGSSNKHTKNNSVKEDGTS